MYRFFLIFLIFLICAFTSGCLTFAKLQKSNDDKYFILTHDYTRTETRGLAKVKWVEGLSAGVYQLVGEDKKGLYFAGVGDCVIVLMNEQANKYLSEGVMPPFEERYKQLPPYAGGVGGIWIPKQGVNTDPKLFFELRNTGLLNQFGIVALVIKDITEKSFIYIPYSSENEFISGLNIVAGKAESLECKSNKLTP